MKLYYLNYAKVSSTPKEPQYGFFQLFSCLCHLLLYFMLFFIGIEKSNAASIPFPDTVEFAEYLHDINIKKLTSINNRGDVLFLNADSYVIPSGEITIREAITWMSSSHSADINDNGKIAVSGAIKYDYLPYSSLDDFDIITCSSIENPNEPDRVLLMDGDKPIVHMVLVEDPTLDSQELLLTVNFKDAALDLSTINGDEFRITGPNGYEVQPIPRKIHSFSTGDVNVEYVAQPPGGYWDASDNGSYQIEGFPGSVRDLAEHEIDENGFYLFQVDLPAGGVTPEPIVNLPSAPEIQNDNGIYEYLARDNVILKPFNTQSSLDNPIPVKINNNGDIAFLAFWSEGPSGNTLYLVNWHSDNSFDYAALPPEYTYSVLKQSYRDFVENILDIDVSGRVHLFGPNEVFIHDPDLKNNTRLPLHDENSIPYFNALESAAISDAGDVIILTGILSATGATKFGKEPDEFATDSLAFIYTDDNDNDGNDDRYQLRHIYRGCSLTLAERNADGILMHFFPDVVWQPSEYLTGFTFCAMGYWLDSSSVDINDMRSRIFFIRTDVTGSGKELKTWPQPAIYPDLNVWLQVIEPFDAPMFPEIHYHDFENRIHKYPVIAFDKLEKKLQLAYLEEKYVYYTSNNFYDRLVNAGAAKICPLEHPEYEELKDKTNENYEAAMEIQRNWFVDRNKKAADCFLLLDAELRNILADYNCLGHVLGRDGRLDGEDGKPYYRKNSIMFVDPVLDCSHEYVLQGSWIKKESEDIDRTKLGALPDGVHTRVAYYNAFPTITAHHYAVQRKDANKGLWTSKNGAYHLTAHESALDIEGETIFGDDVNLLEIWECPTKTCQMFERGIWSGKMVTPIYCPENDSDRREHCGQQRFLPFIPLLLLEDRSAIGASVHETHK